MTGPGSAERSASAEGAKRAGGGLPGPNPPSPARMLPTPRLPTPSHHPPSLCSGAQGREKVRMKKEHLATYEPPLQGGLGATERGLTKDTKSTKAPQNNKKIHHYSSSDVIASTFLMVRH